MNGATAAFFPDSDEAPLARPFGVPSPNRRKPTGGEGRAKKRRCGKRTALVLFWVCSSGAGLWAAPSDEKPVVSKTAPRLDPAALEGPQGNFNTESHGDGSSLPSTEGPRASSETLKSIEQEIEASSHGEVPIVLDPPPTDLPFKEVVGFSRPGQTERVLTGPVDHLPPNEVLNLAILDFRQAMSPLPFQIPSPPFIRMEVPAGIEATNWAFQVEDQAEQLAFQTGGIRAPQDVVSWDGFKDGAMVVLAGMVYQPVLKVTDTRGTPQQYFGDPILLDALQYDVQGVRHVEFHNAVLFQKESSDFPSEAAPLVRSLLNVMRENAGAPYRAVVHEDGGGPALAKKRAEKLKRFLEDALVLESDDLAVTAEALGVRGEVTEFLITLSEKEGS